MHQEAGSKDVIEFHGNNRELICLDCGKRYPVELYLKEMPPRCECRAVLKPNAVFFGEPIPYESLTRAFEEAKTCELLLVIGTSAEVAPASHIPAIAKGNNSMVVEINSEMTNLTGFVSDYLIQGQAGEIVSKIVEKL
jgi:NAD-dependent deacetylase